MYNVLNKNYKIIEGDISYFDSCCRLLDSIKEDFKLRGLDIYQDGYPNYEIIKNDLLNKANTLLLIDENNEVVAQITSTYDELNFLFDKEEVKNILDFYHLDDIPYIGLSRLFVHRSLRSQGIATFLIKEMENKYKNKTVIFFVHLTNSNALRLYESLGFKNLGIYNFVFGEFYTFIKEIN